ncbi:phosphoribosylanthranilate isomerase [bacterium]|jgi:phosphoribosylanthranilate isomerase|nr:phosphoribosylanthranilate isomerase [bacterium]
MKIKICGITSLEDALDAISLGVHAIGFIFYKHSSRYITPEKAEEIVLNLPPFVHTVGVFVNHEKEEVHDIVKRCKLDVVQLHGNESPSFCMDMTRRVIKAIPVSELDDLNQIIKYQGLVSGILLDTKDRDRYGGTGRSFDWGIALKAKEFDMPLILAGGVNISNIQRAIRLISPYGIDISSGVELSPGKKDYNKMKEFLDVAHAL